MVYLIKNTWQNKIIILYFHYAKRKRQKLKTFTLLFFATLKKGDKMKYLVKSENKILECDNFEGAVYVGEQNFKSFKVYESNNNKCNDKDLVYIKK